MGRDNRIKPRAMHYACMIELLGREGLLRRSFGFDKSCCPLSLRLICGPALLNSLSSQREFRARKICS
ncbi:hypothetical protein NC653_035586 [Populus alba x Populus x berolinensis]|nr:hypothetical protein NC653_035586 [Populus alba x Populus x berolinensis]